MLPGNTLQDLHRFDPSSLEWDDFTSIVNVPGPSARASCGVAAISNKLYIFGGENDGGTTTAEK